jgi:uncharacterized protein
MIDLLDINVWLALVDQRHVHHSLAYDYWQRNQSRKAAFCRVTMLGFLRLVTNAKVVQRPKSSTEAWALYQEFMTLPYVTFLTEPIAIDNQLLTLTSPPQFSPHLWTDAYLAAFAIASGCRIVSLDADFSRFPDLPFLHLT